MLRLSRRVWTQLAILGTVTIVACGIMAFGFVKVPALLGIGRYEVTLDLAATGGLYATSVVTYRGDEIGKVDSIEVTQDGVRAVLDLKTDTPVPSDVTAAVHSRSAIGEQFVELTPKRDSTARPLRRRRCAGCPAGSPAAPCSSRRAGCRCRRVSASCRPG
jgi:phospholipid/cholesterol/gamma-HCH transport system substrate-binding protein